MSTGTWIVPEIYRRLTLIGGWDVLPGDPRSRLEEIEAALHDITGRRLLHGFETSAWELVALASRRSYDARIGFEDTLSLPDGSRAEDNGQLAAAAQQIIVRHLPA